MTLRTLVLMMTVAIVQRGATFVPNDPDTPSRVRPLASLAPAERMTLPGPVDSNSPAYWALRHGRRLLHVVTSGPDPRVSVGADVASLGFTRAASFDNAVNGSRWMEAIVPDDDGRLYGYYHNEPANVCGASSLTAPRIGAALSDDDGRTWHDLGIILEAPPDSLDCGTGNKYDAGGVGDFSVMLDPEKKDLYIFYSVYARDAEQQGVAVARMLWSNRDHPRGSVAVWQDGIWSYPEIGDNEQPVYPAATPIFPAARSWHDRSRQVDAFWGPSVHFNTAINQYVMLLNHASDGDFTQEGIYISLASSLEDPREWQVPQRLLKGGKWYPQVIGEGADGTDRFAGESPRLFVSGVSEYVINFERPADSAVAR